ncbi:TPA: chemotaxis protein CheX [Neisseria bacilliformis]|jgi:hypothetical protein|uniref:chemotaxis protein CheX n=1 Tax=Neisseria bacilliformis TaxID=267212 RepID=UPI0028E913BC|nr:chemotaxis protein CheX [Neisseria bacilliformis]
MKEEKLQIFIDGVQKYFAQMIAGEELVVGTPYLIENKIPSAKDFTGVIAISGKNQGVVYFTAPKELLERLLVLIGEKDTGEELMVDLVGEVANTIAGNARSEFGEEFEISVPIVLRGAPDEILLPRKDRSFVIPITWRNRSAAIVISLRK